MRKIKQLTAMLLVLILLVSAYPVSVAAEEPLRFTLNGAEGKCGETVAVTLTVENNPGITALELQIGYSAEDLTLVSVEDARLFQSNVVTGPETSNPFVITWHDANSRNRTENGVLMTFNFKLSENAKSSEVTLNSQSEAAWNNQDAACAFEAVNAAVTVHAHQFTVTRTTDATCTSAGERVLTCACGEFYTEPIAMLPHDFSDNAQYCRRNCGTKNPDYREPAQEEPSTPATPDSQQQNPPAVQPELPAVTPISAVTPAVPKLKSAKKSVTVTFAKVDGATGYEIQYGLKKNFKGAKTKKVKASKAKATLKKLKKGKKYYFRIRAVKGTEKSKWSKKKSIKVK